MAVASLTSASTAASVRHGKGVRVTHVVFDFNGGGMETLIADMAARFRGSSVSVSLITLSGRTGRLGELVRDRFDQFVVLRPTPVVSMLRPVGLARAIRRTRADVVHLHSGSWFKGARAAQLAGVRNVVYTEHGREFDDPWLRRWLDRRAASRTRAVIAVSTQIASYLGTAVGIPPSIIHTIHNGVDTDSFTPAPASARLRSELRIPDGAYVVGSVGRLERVKAYDSLLDAVALLKRDLGRPVVVVLCGEGSQRSMLEEHARRLGLENDVRMPGWSDHTVDVYRLLDVFVLSSTSEGQSVSLMEAMACGASPVVTNVGANAEIVGDGFRDRVVPVGDAATLARAIRAALMARGSDDASNHARCRVVQSYNLDLMVEQYANLYQSLNAER